MRSRATAAWQSERSLTSEEANQAANQHQASEDGRHIGPGLIGPARFHRLHGEMPVENKPAPENANRSQNLIFSQH